GCLPEGITAGPDGNLWFTERFTDKIGMINPTTHAITDFAGLTANCAPYGITAGPDGNLWFAESDPDQIGQAVLPNMPPAANNFAVTLTTANINIAVLAHASDPDGDHLTVTAVTQGQDGTVRINPDGTVTYTLTRFAAGTDTFTYTVSDGRGGM